VTLWYILWLFGIYFPSFLVYCTKNNLATLPRNPSAVIVAIFFDASSPENALISEKFTTPLIRRVFPSRVARLFLAQHTKTVNYTKGSLNISKKLNNIPSGHKIYQIDLKFTQVFYAKAFKKIQKL
jgi:hypothetical protein